MPDIVRRRLLTALAFSPLLAQFPLRAQALGEQRIIALEWLPLELLMALGVLPAGAAELTGYRPVSYTHLTLPTTERV